ncbi:MAG: hypothetical protein WB919_19445 [Candidatus Sulfotelmatobacter sp.]
MDAEPGCPRAYPDNVFAGRSSSAVAMKPADVFLRITCALDESGIAYMLTGSFAGAFYGALRTTQDIDFVIEANDEQLRKFVHLLPAGEYYVDLDAALEARKRESLFNVIDMVTGWKIDFIIRKSRAFSEEEFLRRERVTILLDGNVDLFVATAEDLVISKLEWAKRAQSQRQIEDAASVLRVGYAFLDRPYLRKWILALGLTEGWEAAAVAAELPSDWRAWE